MTSPLAGGALAVAEAGRRGWWVADIEESVADFHARPLPDRPVHAVWSARLPRGAALVLGSAQPDAHVDRILADRAGVPVVRRRSGGGAVLVDRAELIWFDVLVPRGSPLWDDDVGRAPAGSGGSSSALGRLGVRASVHEDGLDRGRWGDRICFAGVGSGEVTVGGRKVVGISQRRVRDQARFQVAILLRWKPSRLVDLLALDPSEKAICRGDAASVAVGLVDLLGGRLVADRIRDEVLALVLEELPPVLGG